MMLGEVSRVGDYEVMSRRLVCWHIEAGIVVPNLLPPRAMKFTSVRTIRCIRRDNR